MGSEEPRTFEFGFAPSYRVPGFCFGIIPQTARVVVGPEELRVRFGPWRLRTPLANIVGVSRTGGFAWAKTAGPPHLSFSDRGVSFATNGVDAVCVQFHEPVAGIDPTRMLKHPGATMTVRYPGALIEALTARGVPR